EPAPGSTLAITVAPLSSDRRDRSVGGTRAVVSSQQLIEISVALRNPRCPDHQTGIFSKWCANPEDFTTRCDDSAASISQGSDAPGACHAGYVSGFVAAASHAAVASSTSGVSNLRTRAW